jgi:hypothetical protein
MDFQGVNPIVSVVPLRGSDKSKSDLSSDLENTRRRFVEASARIGAVRNVAVDSAKTSERLAMPPGVTSRPRPFGIRNSAPPSGS